jgi:hypothetical protein
MLLEGEPEDLKVSMYKYGRSSCTVMAVYGG